MQDLATLIFAITSLHFLMDTFLDLTFQYPCAGWLVIIRSLENMGCIDPVILTASHNLVICGVQKLVDGDLEVVR